MGKFISLFAGVGGFDLGMEKAGHECVAQVEWDKNAAGVLKHRWPNVPLFCDVSKVSADDLPDCEFITYGFPCQDLSIAGQRKGLDGKRSGLFYQATRLIRELIARGCGLRFAVAENVAGLFSADDGLALARCIGELLESGACETGWALLDSQYFGVAQRRKRVFIVSDFGGESVDEILAITESLPGYPAPKQKEKGGTSGNAPKSVGIRRRFSDGSEVSASLTTRSHDQFMPDKGNFSAIIEEQAEILCRASDQANAETMIEQAPTLNCNNGRPLIAQGADVYNGQLTGETATTLTSASGMTNATGPKVLEPKNDEKLEPKIAFNSLQDPVPSKEISPTIGTKQGVSVQDQYLIRRLTPKECERLQGFPDEWTLEREELTLEGNEWKATGKVVKQADGPRYKAMGNAVTVNVAKWIGKQIAKTL